VGVSIGKVLGEAAVSAVLNLNPFGPEGYARRDRNKAFRKARRKARKGEQLTNDEELIMAQQTSTVTLPSGETILRTEPAIPLRTSTKSLLGGTFLAQVYVQIVGLLPYDGLVAALTTPEAIALASVLFAAAVARFTKSPAQAGAI
jgi:hypothetical protein